MTQTMLVQHLTSLSQEVLTVYKAYKVFKASKVFKVKQVKMVKMVLPIHLPLEK